MKKYYYIAGLTVEMDSFGRTAMQAEPYRVDCPSPADIVIDSHWERLQARYPNACAEDCEYLSTGSSFYRALLGFDGLMLHSSAVVVDGKAYLFTANSGTGKSTHTQLWLDHFGDRAYILNDDKPALRLEDGKWYAYGTPWSGKHDISVNSRVPIAGIAAVQRAQENEITPFGGFEAIHAILKQVNKPRDTVLREKLLELLDRLITQVPVWKLCCNMEPEAALIAYHAMSKNRKDMSI